jgi:uncharacterized protein YgiB involved in biofilm formation
VKRSASVRLVFVASLGASLAACDDRKEDTEQAESGPLYRSIVECAQTKDWSDCEATYRDAREEHDRNAPRFASRESCEAEFGRSGCTETAGHGVSGGWFIPAMVGFMAGRALSSPPMPFYLGPTTQGDCRTAPNTPDCASARQLVSSSSSSSSGSVSSGAYAGRSWSSTRSSSSSTASSSGASSSSSTGSVARGGFGASASAHGAGS